MVGVMATHTWRTLLLCSYWPSLITSLLSKQKLSSTQLTRKSNWASASAAMEEEAEGKQGSPTLTAMLVGRFGLERSTRISSLIRTWCSERPRLASKPCLICFLLEPIPGGTGSSRWRCLPWRAAMLWGSSLIRTFLHFSFGIVAGPMSTGRIATILHTIPFIGPSSSSPSSPSSSVGSLTCSSGRIEAVGTRCVGDSSNWWSCLKRKICSSDEGCH